jgi:hypothetical protein
MAQLNLSKAIENLESKSLSLNKEIRKFKKAKSFFTRTSLLAHSLRQKSNQILASAGLIGAILTTPVLDGSIMQTTEAVQSKPEDTKSNRLKLLGFLQEKIPHSPYKFSAEEVKNVEQEIEKNTKIKAVGYLDDQSLNHHLGYIGYEQHLYRYPGDTIGAHDDNQEAGIAPGRGAFGYFAKDASQFTTQDYLREKYYCVVQTLYLDNWNQDHTFLKDWYKFRKVMVVNPVNGNAVICDIGDAGPAEWTGKQFGGSPEVMKDLNLHGGPRKGLVLMFFVDDPNNLVPLGPVNY